MDPYKGRNQHGGWLVVCNRPLATVKTRVAGVLMIEGGLSKTSRLVLQQGLRATA